MLKNCDNCQSQFDIFNEGYGSEFNYILCGKCWKVESRARGIYSLSNAGAK
jgi:hypothetical protein